MSKSRYLLCGFNNGFPSHTASHEDVGQSLKLLPNDYSKGFRNIPTTFINPAEEFLVLPLIFLIDNCIIASNFPDAWKTVRISPIPKISQPKELKDCRSVSIFQVFSKI